MLAGEVIRSKNAYRTNQTLRSWFVGKLESFRLVLGGNVCCQLPAA